MSSSGSVTIQGSLAGMPTGETAFGPLTDLLTGPIVDEGQILGLGTSPVAIAIPSNAQGRLLLIQSGIDNVNVTLKGSTTGDVGVPLGENWPWAYLPVVPGDTYNLVAASTKTAVIDYKIV
jgi:hypothetical protein